MRYACTIGFFDGLHRGHQYLLQQLRAVAAQRGMQTLVVTFDNSPISVLRPKETPQLLTDAAEKRDFIVNFGIDRCEMLHFSPEMSSLTALQFLRLRLVPMGVGLLLMGYDHHFGSDRLGFEQVRSMAESLGVEVVAAEALQEDKTAVSSSEIRSMLVEGRVAEAQELLGRPYMLSGTVVPGRHEGTSLGFPTANLKPRSTEKIIPACGAYAVRATLGGKTYAGMTNIGSRPTLKNGSDISLETHLFGYSGEAYGEEITISFVQRLRDEREFSSLESLSNQLSVDADNAKKILGQ